MGNLCEPEERCFLEGDSMEDAALFSRRLSGMPKSRKREHVSVFSVRVMQPIQAYRRVQLLKAEARQAA